MRRAEIGAMSSIRLRCLSSVCKGPEANSATRHGVWSVRGISVHLIVLVTCSYPRRVRHPWMEP